MECCLNQPFDESPYTSTYHVSQSAGSGALASLPGQKAAPAWAFSPRHMQPTNTKLLVVHCNKLTNHGVQTTCMAHCVLKTNQRELPWFPPPQKKKDTTHVRRLARERFPLGHGERRAARSRVQRWASCGKAATCRDERLSSSRVALTPFPGSAHLPILHGFR